MKKLIICLLFAFIFVSCQLSNDAKLGLFPEEASPQEYFDKVIRHNVVTDTAGHTLILHEAGERGLRNYSFSIEHSPECKKCYEIYD